MRTRRTSILAAAAALSLTGLTAPLAVAQAPAAPAAPDAPSMQLKFFQTPSGNIRCVMYKSGGWGMRCDIYDHYWTAPPQPSCTEGDYGSSVGMKRKKKARFICVSDAIDPGVVVPYGSSITYGPFMCRSRSKGLRCWNEGGHGWFLSRESYQLH